MKKVVLSLFFMAFMQALIGQTHWVPVSGIQNNMTMSAVLYINGEEQFLDSIEIGAFCGEECRAAALPYEIVGERVYFLTIKGTSNEVITFRLYDHQMDTELDYVCDTTYTFVIDDIVGDYPDWFPIPFSNPAPSVVEQTIVLAAGWNWFSAYVESDTLLQQLETKLGDHAIQIKSKTMVTAWDEDEEEWSGPLQSVGMTNTLTYMIETAAACTVTIEGSPCIPEDYTITLNQGWNWIGFPSAVALSVEDALSGFEAMEGDQLKSKTQVTAWDDDEEEWSGSLTTLTPGQGYMFYSNSATPRTLVFQVTRKTP